MSLDELRQFNPDLAKYVTKNPIDSIHMFEGQLDNAVRDLHQDGAKGGHPEKTAATNADKDFPSKT